MGGANNTASGTNATVGGGEGNAASGTWATVAGGEINIASNSQATLSGGYNNYASGSGATVGGGYSNYASGYAATVPGGFLNSATMSYTFAAGKRAKANHEGAFVWGASDDTDFASTAPNHFLVRANRVGINTNAPATTLEVAGLGDGYHTMVLRGTNTSNRRTALQLFSTSGGTPTAEFEIGTDEVSNNSHNFYIYDVTNGMTRLFVDNSGNVGIGTSSPSDTLAVFGDARVGTSGTNGCVKRFDGTAIAGSCSSDVRLKKNIAPFAAMLEPVSQLQPVYYSWRAEEFPQYGFGANTPSYGLIAQEVERVLPELVGRDEYGFKTVNYSELPLVLLQALKELHAEKDAQITALQARVAKLEQNVSAHNVVNVTYDVNAWVIVALGISALALHRGKRGR